MQEQPVDVIILGAGITGSTLGLILARQGLRTLIVDRSPHPRFALGESILKPTVFWLRVMAERFGVEELAVIANVNRIHDRIAPTSGVKKGFGFVRHVAGGERTVAHWWANIAVSFGEDVIEGHLFRQDIDAYLCAQAAAAGCEVVLGADVQALEMSPGSPVRVRTTRGEWRGDFIVDCTSHASPVTREQGLREEPTRLRTNSRAIFTHMIGVRPFDECDAAPLPALAWHEGTLHHILDGAWVWVIPFDNHPRSSNPLVSVGVNFDNTVHPQGGRAPEAEWEELLHRYPVLRAQFEGAVSVRPWVSTGRLQHSTTAVVGDRFALLGQSAGSIDALYSRGLLNSFQCVHLLAELLIDAARDRRFERERFLPLERLQRSVLDVHDALVHGSYIGFRSERLTSWWLAVWSLTERLSLAHVVRPLAALEHGDEGGWNEARAELERGDCVAGQAILLPALEGANAVMDAFAAGALDEGQAEQRLREVAEPLRALGLDLEKFRQLSTRHVFGREARRLLQTEHALAGAIDVIDRHAGFPMRLRTSSLVHGLIRMLATRFARGDDVAVEAPALGPALTEAIRRVGVPGTDEAPLADLTRCLHAVRLERSEVPEGTPLPRARAGWTSLLECRSDGRYVGLRVRPSERGAVQQPWVGLELVTEARGERLVVALDGEPPAQALLARLA